MLYDRSVPCHDGPEHTSNINGNNVKHEVLVVLLLLWQQQVKSSAVFTLLVLAVLSLLVTT